VPQVLQAYASADIGSIAYETRSGELRDAGMVLDEDVILEIVRPGSGDPVPAGEVGEVVVTVFNPDYPLIRFATGDLSAILTDARRRPAAAPTPHQGLAGARRPDHQGARHVRPSVAGARHRAPPSGDRQGAAGGVGPDCAGGDDAALRSRRSAGASGAAAIVESIRKLTKLRGEVQFVAGQPAQRRQSHRRRARLPVIEG
jgi:phenylacetate-CoA ligase